MVNKKSSCKKDSIIPKQAIIPLERIESRIYLIRGEKVMLSTDLVEL